MRKFIPGDLDGCTFIDHTLVPSLGANFEMHVLSEGFSFGWVALEVKPPSRKMVRDPYADSARATTNRAYQATGMVSGVAATGGGNA